MGGSADAIIHVAIRPHSFMDIGNRLHLWTGHVTCKRVGANEHNKFSN